jgi:protein transport protein SEC31
MLSAFYCYGRSEEERETWGFLKVMFEDDGTARTKLLTHLGFNVPSETKDTVSDDLSQEVNAIGLEDTAVNNAGHVATNETSIFSSDNGEDFFNNLPSPKAETPPSMAASNFVVADNANGSEKIEDDDVEVEESSDPSFDDSVQRALVVGDYKGAVSQCISANKWADALVIAHVGSTSLWESTRDQYLKKNRSPYLKVVDIFTSYNLFKFHIQQILSNSYQFFFFVVNLSSVVHFHFQVVSAMVSNDLLSLVNTRPLKFWKETLALLCSVSLIGLCC